MKTVLIVDDEKEIRRFLRMALESEGLAVFEADTLHRGMADVATRRPDLVILDLGLPDGDGIDLLREVRQWSGLPVIVLSARTDEDDKIDALDAGADDYLCKPFGIGELLARVRVALRRRELENGKAKTMTFSDVTVDLAAHTIVRNGEAVRITRIEYRLLTLLLNNVGKILTQQQLLTQVWGPAAVKNAHYLRIYIARLRQKLETSPCRPRHFLTETGIGYRFMP